MKRTNQREKQTCRPRINVGRGPLIDTKPAEQVDPLPDWLFETPETVQYEYVLMMWPHLDDNHDDGDPIQQIYMTLNEYFSLKGHLADVRKLKPVKTVASMERGLRTFGIARADRKAESGPGWMETPDYKYNLETWTEGDLGNVVQQIQITREEFISLKRHLATLRTAKRAA
jgi:hypothetical protein